MLSDYPFRETSVLGVLAQVASTDPPKVDLTVVIVAVVGAISAIGVAYYQFGRRVSAEGKVEKAEEVKKKATDSEAAMATLAERSLALLESLLETEKKENDALRALLEVKIADNEQLTQQLQLRDAKIKELEYELHRLRGHLDSLLNQKGPINVSSLNQG